jgi:hypothetical protein
VEQRFGLLEVGGVQAFGKPVIDLGQQVPCFFAFTLLLPESAQAHGGVEFQGFGLVVAGCTQGMLKTGFPLGAIAAWSLPE